MIAELHAVEANSKAYLALWFEEKDVKAAENKKVRFYYSKNYTII
jgi:hypothetical protein